MPLLIGVGPTNVNVKQIAGIATTSAVMNTGQVTLSTLTSIQIVAANTSRRYLGVMNNSGQSVYLGSTSSVTTANGFELPTGSALNLSSLVEGYTGALWGIAATGSPAVSYIEIG